jgi:hypothetical protein
MFYRMFKGSTDIIPFKSINMRWSLRNPINNILVCDYPAGEYRMKIAVVRKTTDLNQGERFCKMMAVIKRLAGACSVQPPYIYDPWFKFMEVSLEACERV